ncbi:histidine kinase [Variovorax soli]|uniref:Two-component system sensor histidine kinase AlgZ n=1 Tax=Variovorax soli TaxID=376815 RepID=A0ABU1NFT1_9BURK|nr:histidine kinase [Variovorax soli]MDR6537323.1 two-component system sensor histidine kinase AlgZ [Variovorax soli]
MRNPSILSTTPQAPPQARARAPVRADVALFDACQIGVVLRTVMFVEAVVAVVTLFQAPTAAEWLMLLATVTGGALPAALLWLLAACWLKKLLGRLPHPGQYGAGVLLGALSALYGCGLLRLTGVVGNAPWLASALAGAMIAALVMVALVLRARGQTPAATTARLEELQSRIRPHFLFNTLNSAIALVREEPAKAEAMLEDLSELFRHALADAGESVTLADEIALAERYLAIEQVRFGDRLRIRWDIDPAANEARLPPLLLQPLVENAVKHGVEPSPEGAKVRIRTERRGGMAVIEVVNSLPPLRWADEPLPRGHGIALDNVRDRLRLLHDVQAQFSAGMDQKAYRVRIAIPVGT